MLKTTDKIAGYRDALNAVHLNYEHPDLRQSDFLRLNVTMMQIAGDNYIIEKDKTSIEKYASVLFLLMRLGRLWGSWSLLTWKRETMLI